MRALVSLMKASGQRPNAGGATAVSGIFAFLEPPIARIAAKKCLFSSGALTHGHEGLARITGTIDLSSSAGPSAWHLKRVLDAGSAAFVSEHRWQTARGPEKTMRGRTAYGDAPESERDCCCELSLFALPTEAPHDAALQPEVVLRTITDS